MLLIYSLSLVSTCTTMLNTTQETVCSCLVPADLRDKAHRPPLLSMMLIAGCHKYPCQVEGFPFIPNSESLP